VAEQATVVRMVTAGDVVSAVQRACDPRLGAPGAHVLAGLISGCAEALDTPFERLRPDTLGAIGVQALDDTTLRIQLERAAAYFPAVASMAILRPVPQEIIDQYDTAWIEPGNLVTNGPYVLHEHIREVRRVLVRSPLLPDDLRGPGNVERWMVNMVEDQATALYLYLQGRLDTAVVPLGEPATFSDYPGEVRLVPTLGTVYVGFAFDKPPFDKAGVRRAFSAALDRDAFVRWVYPGLPMIHFTPPGVFGAPPADEVGVGYNADYARAQLAEAGYPGCQGIGPLTLLSALPDNQVAFLLDAWQRELGCDPMMFTVTTVDLPTLCALVDFNGLDEARPHLWTGVRWPDYPDVYGWLGDGLYCNAQPEARRPCSAVDDVISQVRWNLDQAARAELARRAEEMFFGAEGEMPLAPWYAAASFRALQPWYSGPVETDGLFGGFHLDWVTLGARVSTP
jgi:oligopeptide transport system substrate-binding protein